MELGTVKSSLQLTEQKMKLSDVNGLMVSAAYRGCLQSKHMIVMVMNLIIGQLPRFRTLHWGVVVLIWYLCVPATAQTQQATLKMTKPVQAALDAAMANGNSPDYLPALIRVRGLATKTADWIGYDRCCFRIGEYIAIRMYTTSHSRILRTGVVLLLRLEIHMAKNETS